MKQWLDNLGIVFKPLPKFRDLNKDDPRDGYLNSQARPLNSKVDAIVLHYTAGGDYIKSSWTWFAMPGTKPPPSRAGAASASAHFLVGRGGEIVQCLPLDIKAWHAGNSAMLDADTHEEVKWVNDFSVGIEIANFGFMTKVGNEYFLPREGEPKRYKREVYGEPREATQHYLESNEGLEFTAYWEPYREAQVQAVIMLCKELVSQGIPANRIVGHQDIVIPLQHKKDPGPLWPWDRLEKALGVTFPSRKVW